MNTVLEHINSAGEAFVGFAWPMLVQSSVLILVLLLVDVVLRKKVRAVVRYWLWMVVLLKLVLPTTLSSPVSLGSWFGDGLSAVKFNERIPAEPVEQPKIIRAAAAEKTAAPPVVTLFAGIKPTMKSGPVTEASVLPPASAAAMTWRGAVFLAWALVVSAMVLLLLQRAIFVRDLVSQAEEATAMMKNTLSICREKMGVKSRVGVKISANTAGPAVCGLFNPVILLPRNLVPNLGLSRLRPVLLHEVAHISRGDLWINFVQTVLQIAYFYNPFLWPANSIIRRIREQAVDEAVQVAMGEEAGKYPQTLIEVARTALSRPALSLRLTGVVESKSALKSRIKRMLARPIPKTARLGTLGLIALFAFAVVLLPMAKATENPPGLVIKGIVKDARTGEPIAGAKVFDDGYGPTPSWSKIRPDKRFEWGAITNSAGRYSFLTWPEHHSIKVEAPGYTTQRRNLYDSHFTFHKKDEEIFDFVLEPEEDSGNGRDDINNGVSVIVKGRGRNEGGVMTMPSSGVTVVETGGDGRHRRAEQIRRLHANNKEEIARKLQVLNEHRERVERELATAENELQAVRRRWNFPDLEERGYPHPVTERLNRLQRQKDELVLEISRLEARVKNLRGKGDDSGLVQSQEQLAELQAGLRALDRMLAEARERQKDLDTARTEYERKMAVRDERLRRLNDLKTEIEQLRIDLDAPGAFDVEIEDRSGEGEKAVDVDKEDYRTQPHPESEIVPMVKEHPENEKESQHKQWERWGEEMRQWGKKVREWSEQLQEWEKNKRGPQPVMPPMPVMPRIMIKPMVPADTLKPVFTPVPVPMPEVMGEANSLSALQEKKERLENEIKEVKTEARELYMRDASEEEKEAVKDRIKSLQEQLAVVEKEFNRQSELFEKKMKQWGEQFGAKMEKWGERFGKEMERWAEQFGGQMEDRENDREDLDEQFGESSEEPDVEN